MRIDGVALGQYARAIQRTRSRRPDKPASPGAPEVDANRVRWRRLQVTHAAERLRADRLAEAAWGGLQDSAPRAALLQLHARVDEVAPPSWEHPDLVQVWFRWADYVVPRADAGVFTVGTLPRDAAQAAALDHVADAVHDVLDHGRASTREIEARLPDLPSRFAVRMASATGRLHIRWDASTIDVIGVERPAGDPEEMRVELARRFVHWLGPVTPAHLATWAGLPKHDAEATWSAIEPDLVEVSFEGRRRWTLTDDVAALLHAEPPCGVRLLPQGDPCLNGGDDQPAAPSPQALGGPARVTSRLVNSLTGRIVVDGDVVGAWGRVKGDVTLDPWPSLSKRREVEVEAEAASFAVPIGLPMRIRWLPRRG